MGRLSTSNKQFRVFFSRALGTWQNEAAKNGHVLVSFLETTICPKYYVSNLTEYITVPLRLLLSSLLIVLSNGTICKKDLPICEVYSTLKLALFSVVYSVYWFSDKFSDMPENPATWLLQLAIRPKAYHVFFQNNSLPFLWISWTQGTVLLRSQVISPTSNSFLPQS